MDDPVKNFFKYSLITTHSLVNVSHTMCTDVKGHKEFSDAGTPSSRTEAWLNRRNPTRSFTNRLKQFIISSSDH